MKNQALFSSKGKSKKLKMSSAAIFVLRFKGLAHQTGQNTTDVHL